MDVAFFFRKRIEFIRRLYLNSTPAFETVKREIEDEEEPFVPPYSEDPEPAFMAEWQEADDSLQVLGYTCLAMLSSSVKLYFTTVERTYGFRARDEFRKVFAERGFLAGYGAFFKDRLGIDFASAPCDLALLEEVILIRNRFEHPSHIFEQQITHPGSTSNSPSMFFCRDSERAAWDEVKTDEGAWLMSAPRVHIDEAGLSHALDNAERFCNWLEEKLTDWQYSNGRSEKRCQGGP